MHLTFQNPMQYLLYLLDFLSAPDTFKAERHSRFGPATSFLLQLSVIDLHSSVVVYWTPSNLGGHLFAFLCCPWGSRGKNTVQFSSIAQLCPTLCDPMDCSPPGSSVHGIIPVGILEWAAISCSRGSSWPRDWTLVSCIGRWILYHCATWEA